MKRDFIVVSKVNSRPWFEARGTRGVSFVPFSSAGHSRKYIGRGVREEEAKQKIKKREGKRKHEPFRPKKD